MCNGYGVNPIAAQMNQVFVLNSLFSAGTQQTRGGQVRRGVRGAREQVTVQKFITGSTSVVEGE